MKSLKYLNKYFLKYKLKISAGFLFIIMANIFALFPAHLIGKSFDLIVGYISPVSDSIFSSTNMFDYLCDSLQCMLF